MKDKDVFMRFDHIGIVVKDMDRAVDYYQSLGIGPFEKSAVVTVNKCLKGKPAPLSKAVRKDARMGQAGIQITQPVEGQSMTREYLEQHGEGINHIAFIVDNLKEATELMTNKGLKILFSASYQTGGGEVWLDTAEVGGFYIQLIEEGKK